MNIAKCEHHTASRIPEQAWPELELVTSPTVTTEAAAYYLNRRPQTLRTWACHETGALRPIRINGRLAWSVADIRHLVSKNLNNNFVGDKS